ncbi:protein AMN1 homolog [Sebastes fasciatus]|uniref:protein AMN1 homolog n=1 Tax=Sebastes fasciatus TaxID=394691 RepID=UPI003D9E1B8B
MQSCAWMNGQQRQVGPPTQSSQDSFTHNTTRNQQAGTANISWQYGTAKTGVRPPHNANLNYRDGAYSNRQPSNWQTSAVPHQAVSSQQSAGGNNYYLKMFLTGNLPHSSANTQSGYPGLPVTCVVQQDQNSSTQSPPNMVEVNTTYPQQNMSAHWNQSVRVQSMRTRMSTMDGNVVSDLQYCRDKNSLFHNGQSTKPVSAYTTTATSLPREEVTYTGTYRQTAHNNNPKQNVPQLRYSPPSYNTAVSQSFRNNSITTNSSSNGHHFLVSSMSPKTQQYSTHNSWGEATSSINSNSYSRQYEASLLFSKTNGLPLNPAVDTQQEMRQKIAKIEDYLRNPSTAGTDGRPPVNTNSPHGQQQFGSKVRITASNQNMQPVTSTVTETYNLNAFQSLPLNSGQYLPKTTHSVMSTQHSLDVPSVVTATQDGSKALVPKKIVGSLSDVSQLMQLPEGISPQRKETQSSVANNREKLEMLSSVKANDSSIHLSPGRTRAVAVVQPLSQESYQVASKQISPNTISKLPEDTATDVSLSNPEKLFISPYNKQDGPGVGPYLYLENPNQMRYSKSAIRQSAASNDGTIVSSSNTAGPQDLSKKQLCADDTGSELAIDIQVDQRVAPTAQQSVTSKVTMNESGEKDESEMPTDPKEVLDLSSVPTTPWMLATLNKLIQDGEKAQMELNDCSEFSTLRKLLSMFWDCNLKKLLHDLKTCLYKDCVAGIEKFCSEHETPDSVILSQVESGFGKQLESYHVLKDNDVYSERPYKSSWLNINEQLDDIDKDFDFPWSLKRRLHTLESDSQSDQVKTDDGIPVQIASEVSNKMLSSIKLEPVDSSEEKQDSTVEAISTQTASPNKVQSDFSDPYSFEIQVLPPEEAKVIFEQVQSKLPQSMDTDNQPEIVTNSSAESELPRITDAPLSDRKLENESFCPIEEVCCIERLKEIIWGSNTASLSKCQCKYKQSHKDVTEKTMVKEEVAVQKKDELCAIRSDSKFHSATEGENQAKGKDNDSYQVMTFDWPELCNELSHTIDLTEDDNKPHSYSDKEPQNVSQRSINSSQLSIILISKNEDHLSSLENEFRKQIPDLENESSQSSGSDEKETKKISRSATEIQSDPEVGCVQDQLRFIGNAQSCTSDSSDKELENLSSSESEVASEVSALEEHSEAAQVISTNEEESSLETEEETEISVTGARQTTWSGKHETAERKGKRLSSHDRFFPVFKKSKKFHVLEGASKCGKIFLDETDGELSASNIRTVELVLFGSTPQDKRVLTGSRKSHVSSPNAVFDAVPSPPLVLTVNLSPMKRKSRKTISTWEFSVKQLYKKWKISLPPTKIRRRSKLKAQKCSSFGGSLKKADTVGPANNEELPFSSEMRIWNKKTKPCLTLKRRWSLSNRLKRGEEKTENHTITLNQPADQERSEAENGSHAVMPLQNSDVLKFSVLPNSFSFKDGYNGTKETKDPVPDKPEFVEGKNKSHNNTVMRARGTWYSIPERKCFSPPVPKTDSIFHEFQKKYKEKTLTPIINE